MAWTSFAALDIKAKDSFDVAKQQCCTTNRITDSSKISTVLES